MHFYKYHGAGNDFLIADGREGAVELTPGQIASICARHTGIGADGVMILENDLRGCLSQDSGGNSTPQGFDFRMEYFNSDGSGGMMCGNGGRCIVAFAADLGIKGSVIPEEYPSEHGEAPEECYAFIAPDGSHTAAVLKDSGREKSIRLKMRDVSEGWRISENEFFLDTGTRHYVRFVKDLDSFPVTAEGMKIRHDPRFAPKGVNANFVEADGRTIRVRTYEKGVEEETLACGTGIVASAIAAYLYSGKSHPGRRVSYDVRSRISRLKVDFVPGDSLIAEDVYLTGPTSFVGEIDIEI